MAYRDELKEVENALRLLIERVGMDNLVIRARDLNSWRERRARDLAQRGAGFPEDRLLYYADIADLKTIITKESNWPLFDKALLNRTEIGVLLDILRRIRNPDAHNRELSGYEQSLAIGISGEIRTRITRYLGRMDSPDTFFPQILSFQDSLGTSPGSQPTLRVGDEVEFIVDALDPLGEDLEYRFIISRPGQSGPEQAWGPDNRFRWKVIEANISASIVAAVYVRSARQHHAFGDFDASRNFNYSVLPGPR